MKRTPRLILGTGLVLASMFAVPAVAGADSTCYTGCIPPHVSPSSVTVSPTGTDPVHTSASTIANGSSSLPFTGADIGELAAIGAGAVVIGGVLTRRRRTA